MVFSIPFEPQRTLQPLAGGGVIPRLNVMPADVGGGEIAVGIEPFGGAVMRAGLGVAVQPVEAHAGSQIIVTVKRIKLPGARIPANGFFRQRRIIRPAFKTLKAIRLADGVGRLKIFRLGGERLFQQRRPFQHEQRGRLRPLELDVFIAATPALPAQIRDAARQQRPSPAF